MVVTLVVYTGMMAVASLVVYLGMLTVLASLVVSYEQGITIGPKDYLVKAL